jgi:hypothetical protein
MGGYQPKLALSAKNYRTDLIVSSSNTTIEP